MAEPAWEHPSQCKWCGRKFAATTWDDEPVDECFVCWRKVNFEYRRVLKDSADAEPGSSDE